MNKNLIDISVNTGSVQQALQRLQSSVADMAPLMNTLSATLLSTTQLNFMDQGNPSWVPSVASRRRSGQTLSRSGRLRDSVTADSDSQRAMVGTNVVYAAIHQLGGKTRAHIIRPRHKKALAFGGLVRKSVNHPGSDIPARPFLPVDASGSLQQGVEQTLTSQITDYLAKSARGEI